MAVVDSRRSSVAFGDFQSRRDCTDDVPDPTPTGENDRPRAVANNQRNNHRQHEPKRPKMSQKELAERQPPAQPASAAFTQRRSRTAPHLPNFLNDQLYLGL